MKNKRSIDRTQNSVFQTITKMAPAVLTALFATALGFLALNTSPVPMIQHFGKMLTIGMVVSFFIALFLLIPILYTRDHFFNSDEHSQRKNGKPKSSTLEHGFAWITKKVMALRWFIVIFTIILAMVGVWVDLDAEAETDIETFMPQDTQELADIHRLREIIGTTDQLSLVYEGDNLLSKQSVDWVHQMTESLREQFPNVVVKTNSLTSVMQEVNDGEISYGSDLDDFLQELPVNQRKLLINEDESKGVITVGIKHLEAGDLKDFIIELERYIHKHEINDLDTTITGKSIIDVEMVSALTTGRYKMTLLGMGLVFLGLLLIYRHPVKALIPLLPILLIVGWSGGLMYLMDVKYTPLTATLGALIIGVGTEFTILVMERFYEERKKGKSREEAMVIASRKIGTAIFASALTTIGGFSALLASDFIILNNFGMMTLINVSLALFSTIVVMPAILVLCDRLVKTKIKDDQQVKVG
ncbi:efflux RND transporter permease subunit [Oceanobacillus sp. CAU 1775]